MTIKTRKSSAFKFLVLLVLNCGVLALEPVDPSSLESKLELAKAKEPHEKFFDIDESGTISYSLGRLFLIG